MKITLAVCSLFLVTEVVSQIKPPANLNDGIKTGVLSEVGMDGDVIREIDSKITSGYYPNIHSLLIFKDGRLVYENYFGGKDEIWGNDQGVINHAVGDLHDVRSISKSFVSACVGIAIGHGKIKDVNQRVFDFFKEYSALDTGMIKGLTIKHLLTMTSGLKWNEDVPYTDPENSEIQMTTSNDPIGFILSQPLTAEPGKEWKYNGGTTQAAIIERVSGQGVDEFANEYLFKPLGITKFEWVKFPGTDDPAAASGLRLRSRDLLKFGMMYHNGGKWIDRQVVPTEWVEKSIQSWVNLPGDDKSGYGFQFWIWDETIRARAIKIVGAVGNGDQRIFLDQKNHLLVVITAGNYNLWDIENNSAAVLRRVYESFVPR